MGIDLKGRNVLVLGLGESGFGVAQFLREERANVIVNDIKNEEAFKDLIPKLKELNISYLFGEHPVELLNNIDLLVISPGISKDNPIYKEASKRGVKVIGEIELAYLYSKVPIIAVTGTKGKSTTSTLIGEILNAAQIKNIVAGNIGVPFVNVVKTLNEGFFILEVSSFQLEDIETFCPYISLFINIYPDHLDRYKGMEEYAKAKAKIFMNQKENDFAILNYDQKEIRKLASICRAQKLFFSLLNLKGDGIFLDGSFLNFKINGKEGKIKVPLKCLKNQAFLNDFMAASLVALILGINPETIEEVGENFKGISFTLEKVGEVKGRIFINDSKATNPISTIYAVRSISSPIWLILGGRNKKFDFEELFKNIKISSVRGVILIGETKEIMRELAQKYDILYFEEDALEEAVLKAFKLSVPGDIILLSPGCASFDMFENYKERGKSFNRIVESIKDEKI
ncbi:MAG: UDP-N-acetylmuramoyl-L-alanine--D-glutamate ligase [Dictyoglomaceae bacterium]|nr:UDP-N-acetylmuramoyl-L-alanine--D-glutamate ligase [Dictyoglomaceae bacterium]HPU43716.1 UDP-N-acetylmuramoyl-L-alanine--D-glutamate ligase [Dictyoglomaceae bacterium]